MEIGRNVQMRSSRASTHSVITRTQICQEGLTFILKALGYAGASPRLVSRLACCCGNVGCSIQSIQTEHGCVFARDTLSILNAG